MEMGSEVTKRISSAEARLAEFEAEMKAVNSAAETLRGEIDQRIRQEAVGGQEYPDKMHESDLKRLNGLEAKASKYSTSISAVQNELSNLAVEKGREDLETARQKIENLHADAAREARNLMAATASAAKALEALRRSGEEVERVVMDEIRPSFLAAKPGVKLPADFSGQTGSSWVGLLARFPDLPCPGQDPVDRLALKGWVRHGDVRRPLIALLGE